MTKSEPDSEYSFIKKWYQETEAKMDLAWGQGGRGFEIEAVAQVMFLETSKLLEKLAPDADIYALGKVQNQFGGLLVQAKNEFEKQKQKNPALRFTRGDGIFPAIIQSFFHAIAKYFRKDKPRVADLMEDAARIVYEDARQNSKVYTAERQVAEGYEAVQSRALQKENEDLMKSRTPEQIAGGLRMKAIFDQDRIEGDGRAGLISQSAISGTVLAQAKILGAGMTQDLSLSRPSNTSLPHSQVSGHGRGETG